MKMRVWGRRPRVGVGARLPAAVSESTCESTLRGFSSCDENA